MTNIYSYDLWQLERVTDEDSNEVIAARGVIKAYNAFNGIADEMSADDLYKARELETFVEAAIEVLKARDLV